MATQQTERPEPDLALLLVKGGQERLQPGNPQSNAATRSTTPTGARLRRVRGKVGKMSKLAWSDESPWQPGWYWCRTKGDKDGPHAAEWAVFVVRVDWQGTELVGSWLAGPGVARMLPKSDWAPDALWSKEIDEPEFW